MTFSNTNRKAIREAEKAYRLDEASRIEYTRHIMSDLFGRAWMHSLLLSCNVFHTPFVAAMGDMTAFNCGKQNVGLRIFGDIAAHCPAEYTLMMTEASIKEQANGRRNESLSDPDTDARTGARRDAAEPVGSYTVDANGFVVDTSGGPEDPDTGAEGSRSEDTGAR